MTTTPSAPATSVRTLLGRQPIWSRTREVYGHEYLYRSPSGRTVHVDRWSAARQDVATAAVLDLLDRHDTLGLADDLFGPLAFVNVTRSYVVGSRTLPARPGRLVVEVVESVPGDQDVLAGLLDLKAQGFQVAIDDFVATPDQLVMLPFADYVKIDVRDLDRTLGYDLVAVASEHGATLVAERVETEQLVDRCVDLGFDLLQGDALAPTAVLVHDAPLVPSQR